MCAVWLLVDAAEHMVGLLLAVMTVQYNDVARQQYAGLSNV